MTFKDCRYCDTHSLKYPEEYVGHILLEHVTDGTQLDTSDEKLYEVLKQVRFCARISGIDDALDFLGEPECSNCIQARGNMVNRRLGFIEALDDWDNNIRGDGDG